MISRKIVYAALITVSASALMFGACRQNSNVKDPFMRIGNVTVGKAEFDAFGVMARSYPAPMPDYFPAQRQTVTFMADCEAIYQSTKSSAITEKITSSLDWKWKKKYFASLHFFDLFAVNLGLTDDELKEYYNRSPEEFRAVTQTEDGQDSSYIPEFDNVKRQVADALFCERYKPDSAFLARMESESHGHDHDEATVRNHWLYNARSNPPDFFMRQFFLERTGQVYNDDEQQLYGPDKPIASEDIDVIKSWVPENRRGMRMKELIEWLYKWQVFSEYAELKGLTAKPEHKHIIHWALRAEYAAAYLRDEVYPKLVPQTSEADIGLAELMIHDMARHTEQPPPGRLKTELDNIVKFRASTQIDSVVYGIRKRVGVTFLQDEWKDERSSDPAALFALADSLKEAATDPEMEPLLAEEATNNAEKHFRTLAHDFAFAAEGRKAMGELAKMMVEKYATSQQQRHYLQSALTYYRRGMLLDPDRENLCNGVFMAGFVYDEHEKQYTLAEANYKWILRNAPDCALASDAEFMLLHLGEPMTSIEEIQGQSLRQGRTVELDEELPDDGDETPAT